LTEQTAERLPRLLNIESVMDQLGVGRSTVFALLASGQLRSLKVGRRRLVPESAIVQFIDSLQFTGGGNERAQEAAPA
jgi:excisionase family DNA binding protein